MPYYENVFIVRQDVSVTAVKDLSSFFQVILEERGGKVTKSEYGGLKNLMHRIKKNKKGHYMLLNIDAPIEAIHEMERKMRLNEDVIRFLTVKVQDLDPNPSPLAQSRFSRDKGDREFDSSSLSTPNLDLVGDQESSEDIKGIS